MQVWKGFNKPVHDCQNGGHNSQVVVMAGVTALLPPPPPHTRKGEAFRNMLHVMHSQNYAHKISEIGVRLSLTIKVFSQYVQDKRFLKRGVLMLLLVCIPVASQAAACGDRHRQTK